VRGLDYYTRTTFEVLGETLGAQNAILGGGRYDGLVKDLGGPDRTGIGFAAGLERLVLALPEGTTAAVPARAFVVAIGDDGRAEALRLLRELRQAGLPAQMELEARGMKAQMKRADRLQARIALIVGGDELARGEVTLRDMRTGDQRAVPRPGVVEAARALLA
jgi:histidyl-tRNA synthetase